MAEKACVRSQPMGYFRVAANVVGEDGGASMLIASLSLAGIVTGLVSAALWFYASRIRVPQPVWIEPGAGGGRPSPQLEFALNQLAKQSKFNARAAIWMATSVICQAGTMLLTRWAPS
jgi:hypothetical protein